MSDYEVLVRDGQIVVNDEVVNLLNRARMLDITIKELTTKRDAIINSLKSVMNKNGIDSFKSGIVNISRTEAKAKEEINVEKMKKDGIYEKYAYTVPTGGYLRVTYPKVKNDD